MSFFIPFVMSAVLLLQLCLVEVGNLDRWKGMGMGMFSGIRDRALVVFDVKATNGWQDERQKLVEEFPKQAELLKQFPNNWSQTVVEKQLQSQNFYDAKIIHSRFEVVKVSDFNQETGVISKESVYASD